MTSRQVLLLAALAGIVPTAVRPPATAAARQSADGVSRERAAEIAREDAVRAYGSVDNMTFTVTETKSRWLVVFELKDKNLDGGAPSYEIDKKSGRIVKKVYQQ